MENTATLPGDVTTRKWPPEGWRNLTPDQRKLQWEFMVFQYEQSSGKVSSLNRAGRLDTYNMFALLGTAPHAKVKYGRTTITSCYYLYESMRLLSLEEQKPDFNTFIILDILEKASAGRDRPTYHICRALEDSKIPLRLDA